MIAPAQRRRDTFSKLDAQADVVRKARDAYFGALQQFCRNVKHAGMATDVKSWLLETDFGDLLPPTVLSDLSFQQLEPLRRT